MPTKNTKAAEQQLEEVKVTPNLPVPIEDISPETAPSIYKTGGLQPYFDYIKSELAAEVPDLTTSAGRKRIASLAAAVSKSKTLVEKPGRDYLREVKALPKLIEDELRGFTRACDALRDEIRAPLTRWEEAEKNRKQKHEDAINKIKSMRSIQHDTSSDDVSARIQSLTVTMQSLEHDTSQMDEYGEEYLGSIDDVIEYLQSVLPSILERENQAAEIEKLKREAAAREAAAREDLVRIEAENRAKREAEESQRQKEVELRMQAERAERAAEEAKRRAEEAEEQARRKYEAEKDAAKAREADVEHRRKINQQALASLESIDGISQEDAKKVLIAIAKGQVANVSIYY